MAKRKTAQLSGTPDEREALEAAHQPEQQVTHREPEPEPAHEPTPQVQVAEVKPAEKAKHADITDPYKFPIHTDPSDRSKNKFVRVFNDHRAERKCTAIVFDVNPNEGRTKEEAEAILKPIRDAGFRWGRVPGEKAWTKKWPGDRFSYAVQLEAKHAAEAAAKIMNPQQQQEQSIPL